ncbi:integrating conjugative element protein [Sodalis ligni]|uniref:Integrating conjugative element protein (TIGR03765 family) n=1 Tax=Sodalis ligni TaxID=2697027 RepID=A0A4R1N533_9GAMM|nr:integrating conjugative element protein [Sodalis ligni]TCL02193.1 integrating conjugative element protein (TIGR03765 family) [Sodalis ligni]
MKKIFFLLLTLALFHSTAFAQSPSTNLIVVEDRGGVSALPYYRALAPQELAPSEDHEPAPTPHKGGPADAEASMLPVRSMLLSPGVESQRIIRAPGLSPLFLIGDDESSRTWLQQHRVALSELNAIGLVVNVETAEALASLRHLAPDLRLSPVPADDLAQRLGIRHYPVLITATGIEP